MAKLDQVIGAILKDITQARVEADVFAIEASRQYHAHPLLQHFPVPRIDIQEAEIELKFAIAEARLFPTVMSKLIENFAADAARILLEKTIAVLSTVSATVVNDSTLIDPLRTIAAREGLEQVILPQMITDQDSLFEDAFQLDTTFAVTILINSFRQFRTDQTAVFTAVGLNASEQARLTEVWDLVSSQLITDFQHTLDLKVLNKDNVELEILVASDKLQKLPAAAVSEIKFTTSIQNYTWARHSKFGEEGSIGDDSLIPIN
ncbi:MAG: hypothetical protein AAF587_16550 [Bacteroidota bacterium]